MRNRSKLAVAGVIAAAWFPLSFMGEDKTRPPASPLDAYVAEAAGRTTTSGGSSAGSIWSASGRLADLVRDPRARAVDDVVTVLVVERASAAAKGTTKSARASSAKSSLGPVAGITRTPLAGLAGVSGGQQLAGEGATSRESVLETTLTARVTGVLPNGSLLVEGSKTVQVNAEQQTVVVRGVARPSDLTPQNVIRSDRLANLEVRINGKGVVGDAVRRPFFLYRLLLGLLPF
ncbi:MAG: flagellar basal body L-ring protein FlgH [Bryobacterales bacterium]|nr:flagellar basal body L-ring protein FlgH [Bryobacterales bacterium]